MRRDIVAFIVFFVLCAICAKLTIANMDEGVVERWDDEMNGRFESTVGYGVIQCTIDSWSEPFTMYYAIGAGHMIHWSIDEAIEFELRSGLDFGQYLIDTYGYEAWALSEYEAYEAKLYRIERAEYLGEVSGCND